MIFNVLPVLLGSTNCVQVYIFIVNQTFLKFRLNTNMSRTHGINEVNKFKIKIVFLHNYILNNAYYEINEILVTIQFIYVTTVVDRIS